MSFGFAVAFPVILTALHILDPELAIGHLISEYQRGRHGWLMSVAFLSLGVSATALFLAVRPVLSTRGGRLGARWLSVIGVAYAGAAVFPPDSAAGLTAPAPATTSVAGMLHGVFGLIIIGTSPLACTLLGRSLARHPRWRAQARRVRWLTFLPWLGLVTFAASLVGFGLTQPQTRAWEHAAVLVSVSNRLLIGTYCAWLMVTSLGARQALGHERSPSS